MPHDLNHQNKQGATISNNLCLSKIFININYFIENHRRKKSLYLIFTYIYIIVSLIYVITSFYLNDIFESISQEWEIGRDYIF